MEKLGREKEFSDIVEYAAVLTADELITWVAPQKAKHTGLAGAIAKQTDTLTDTTSSLLESTVSSISEKAQLMLESVSEEDVNAIVDRAVKSLLSED